MFRIWGPAQSGAQTKITWWLGKQVMDNVQWRVWHKQVDKYNKLLDEVTQTLSSIHSSYTSSDAPRQIDISSSWRRRLSTDIRQSTNTTIPGLETLFVGVQDHIEKSLASDIYPRFVKHQVTASASMALAENRERFAGLGDCFCLTDPGYVSPSRSIREEVVLNYDQNSGQPNRLCFWLICLSHWLLSPRNVSL